MSGPDKQFDCEDLPKSEGELCDCGDEYCCGECKMDDLPDYDLDFGDVDWPGEPMGDVLDDSDEDDWDILDEFNFLLDD